MCAKHLQSCVIKQTRNTMFIGGVFHQADQCRCQLGCSMHPCIAVAYHSAPALDGPSDFPHHLKECLRTFIWRMIWVGEADLNLPARISNLLALPASPLLQPKLLLSLLLGKHRQTMANQCKMFCLANQYNPIHMLHQVTASQDQKIQENNRKHKTIENLPGIAKLLIRLGIDDEKWAL